MLYNGYSTRGARRALEQRALGTESFVQKRWSVLCIFNELLQGKSLSLICGSMTWLRDFKSKVTDDGIETGIGGRRVVHRAYSLIPNIGQTANPTG